MSNLFDDIDIDLNFLGDRTNQQGDHLRHYFDTAEFNREFSSNNAHDKTLKILNMNIRSISANGTDFVAYLGTLDINFDIICLTETWMNERRKIINHFPNYNSFESSRPLRDGGGVLVLVRQELSASEIPNTNHNSDVLECVFVEVADTDKTFAVGCCYRPPSPNNSYNSSCFTNLLSEMLHSISGKYHDCFVCGDFNLDLLKIDNDHNISRFYDSINSLAFIPVISKPTRITDDSFSLIDNIFVNNPFNYKSGILKFDLTDHLPTFIILKNYFTRPTSKQSFEFRLINDRTLQNLYANLSEYSYDFTLSLSCENSLDLLNNLILEEYNKCCPIITKEITRRDQVKPWITHSVKSYIQRRQNLYKLYKNN